MVEYHTLQRSQCATVAQPVEQLTRNEQVVRSNRISSSKVKSPKSGFAPDFSGIFCLAWKMLFEGDVGADCPNFPEGFFEMQVKMQVKKGKKQVGRVLAEKAALFS